MPRKLRGNFRGGSDDRSGEGSSRRGLLREVSKPGRRCVHPMK
jgi:hypothetical protein